MELVFETNLKYRSSATRHGRGPEVGHFGEGVRARSPRLRAAMENRTAARSGCTNVRASARTR
jgi:hypothetical protein